jgi:hypothetical protein
MFQSLTGSIHTLTWQVVRVGDDENNQCFNPSQVQFTPGALSQMVQGKSPFQSLTGSIHTYICVDRRKQSYVFQSLTGSIHTKCDNIINLDL